MLPSVAGHDDTLDGARFVEMIARARAALTAHRRWLDELNRFPIPDRDTGANLVRTVDAAYEAVGGVSDTAAADVRIDEVASLAVGAASRHARGNSGVILSEWLAGLVQGWQPPGVRAAELPHSLAAGARRARAAIDRPVEGTILTMADAAAAASGPDSEVRRILFAARAGAAAALPATPELLPALGGVVDSGGAGLVIVLDGFCEAFGGGAVDRSTDPALHARGSESEVVGDRRSSARLGGPEFEVVLSVTTVRDDAERIRAGWSEIGESIGLAGGPAEWRLHVHTSDPGRAEEIAAQHGQVTDLVVEPMLESPPVGPGARADED